MYRFYEDGNETVMILEIDNDVATLHSLRTKSIYTKHVDFIDKEKITCSDSLCKDGLYNYIQALMILNHRKLGIV